MQALLQKGFSRGQIVPLERSASAIRTDKFLSGEKGKRSAVLVLFNIAESYLTQLPPDRSIPPHQTAIAKPEYRLRVTSTQPSPLPDGTEVVVVHATPQQLVVWDREHTRRLSQRDFATSTLDPASLDYARLHTKPPHAERMPLSAETMDLVIAKYLPDSLTGSELERMMPARWAYEAQIKVSEAPDWGRFFVPGKPKPRAEQRAALLPRFRQWSINRVGAMPARLTLFYNSSPRKSWSMSPG